MFTTEEKSPKGKLSEEDLKRFFRNLMIFTAPALLVLFYQLSQGASLKVAAGLALLAFYGVLADFFQKLLADNGSN